MANVKQNRSRAASQRKVSKKAVPAKQRVVHQAHGSKARSGLLHGNPAWKPGVSGNPNGRPPKRYCIPDILRCISDEEIAAEIDGRVFNKITNIEAACRAVFRKAKQGDAWANEFIAERTEGKVKQVIENINHDIDVGFE